MAARNMAQSEKCSPHKPASLSMVSNIWHEKPGVLTPACSASAGKAEKGHPGRAGQLVQLNWWALGLMRDTVLKVRQWVTKEDPKSPLASTHLHAHAQTPHKHAHRDDKSIFHIGRSYPQIQVQSRISKPQTWSAPSLKHLPKTNKCTHSLCVLAALAPLIWSVHLRLQERLHSKTRWGTSHWKGFTPTSCNLSCLCDCR